MERDQEQKQATDTTPVEATPPAPDAVSSSALVESIARLIAELAEVRVISDRRADQLVSQAETIGRLRAELAALRASQSPPAAQGEPREPEPTTEPSSPSSAPQEPGGDGSGFSLPWWRRWLAAVYGW